MRKIILGLAPALVLLSASAAAAAPEWKVSEVSGNVRLTENGRSRAAVRGALLASGATITTGQGARAVIVRGEEFVIVSPASQLRVPGAAERNGVVQMIEDFGTAMFKITRKSTPHFGVKTPYLAAVVKGTTFTITVGAEGSTVQVTEGSVEVSTNDGGARDLVTPGVIASVGARDLYQLRIQGDASKVIRSDKAPSASVVTVKPLAYQGPPAAVVQISVPVVELSTSLQDVTNGLLQGSASFDLAALDLQSRSANAVRDTIAEPARTSAGVSLPVVQVPDDVSSPIAETPKAPKPNQGNNGGGNATGNPGAGNNGNGTDGRGNAGPSGGAPAPLETTPPPPVVAPVTEAPAPPVVEAPAAPVAEPVAQPVPVPVVEPAPVPVPVVEPIVAPIAEPVVVPVPAPVVEPVPAPVIEPVVEVVAPVTQVPEPAVEPLPPVAEPALEPAPAIVPEPVTLPEPPTQPIVEPVLEPVVAPIEEPSVEPPVDPIVPIVVEPVPDPLTLPEPLVQPILEPIVQPIAPLEPVPQPVLEPVDPLLEPIVAPLEPIVEPVMEPVEPLLEPIAPVAEPLIEPVNVPEPALCLLFICL